MLVNHICTLDIGTSKIAGCVAVIKKGRIAGIFFETVPLKGIHKGSVIDSLELVAGISRIMKSLKHKSGLSIKAIYTNISGQDIITKHSRAIIPLAERGNKVITLSDIQKVNDQAVILGSSLEEEIIHKIPFSYATDSKPQLANPFGLYSHKLEVDMYLICSKLATLQSFIHAVNQAGYDVKGVFLSGLATSELVLQEEHAHGLTILCDIGADVTECLFFNDGVLRNIEIMSIGGNDLSRSIQDQLKIPFDFAEDIKISYGLIGDPEKLNDAKEILIKKEGMYEPVKQRLVADCITSSAYTMLGVMKETIEKHGPCTQVKHLVVCGRTILQEGMLEILESSLGIPTQLARITNPALAGAVSKHEALAGHKYVSYVTALGILALVLREHNNTAASGKEGGGRNPAVKLIYKIKDIYQEYF